MDMIRQNPQMGLAMSSLLVERLLVLFALFSVLFYALALLFLKKADPKTAVQGALLMTVVLGIVNAIGLLAFFLTPIPFRLMLPLLELVVTILFLFVIARFMYGLKPYEIVLWIAAIVVVLVIFRRAFFWMPGLRIS